MDNNFNNGMPQPDMNQQMQADTVQPQPYGMPQPDMSQQMQADTVQPQPDMNQQMQNDTVQSQPYGMPQPDMSQQMQADTVQSQPDMNQQMQADTVQPQPYGMPQPDMSQQMYGQQAQPNTSRQMYGQQAQPNMSQQMYGQQAQPNMSQQMYGQQAQPNMNQQVPQAQPVNAGGGNGSGKPPKPPKVKKPMTGGKLAGIICGGIAAVAAIVCGVIFIPKLFRTDKEVVIDAFEATLVTDTENVYMEDTLGLSEIQSKLQESGGTIRMNFGIDDVEGVNAEGVNVESVNIDLGFAIEEVYNPVDKLIEYSIEAFGDGDSLIKLNYFGDETNTYVEFENIIDGYFMIPNDDPIGALASSCFGDELDAAELAELSSVFQLDYFGTDSSDGTTVDINSGYVNAVEELWDKAEFEKQGNAKIDVNGKTVTAKEYTVTLREENIENAFVSIFDGVKETYENDPDLLDSTGMDYATFEATIAQAQQMIPSLISGDFVVKVYIKDKEVVKITSADDISLYGVSMSYDFFLDIDDNDIQGAMTFDIMGEAMNISFEAHDLQGNANGKAVMSVEGDTVEFVYNSTVDDTDAASNVKYNCDVLENGDTIFSINGEKSVNKSDNSFHASMTMGDEFDEIAINISGKLTDINKGVSFKLVIDEITLDFDEDIVVKMNMEYAVDTSANTARKYDSSKKVYELATLTETEYENLIDENNDLIMNWLEKLMDNAFINTLLDVFTVYPDEENFDNSDLDESVATNTVDDMIIEDGGIRIRILESLPGLTCTYDGITYAIFNDDNNDYDVTYMIFAGMEPRELVDLYFEELDVDAEDAVVELDSELTLSDGSTVYYSFQKGGTDEFSYGSQGVYAKDLGNGACVVAAVFVIGHDVTSAELGEVLLDKNFELLQ
ncbi:MAG: hypothetical protein NC428_07325 [Clostridium sp.]|nr:hypothetical protein [Clostridium sp.]